MSSLLTPYNAYDHARQRLALELWDVGAVLTNESNHPLVVERPGPIGVERGFRSKMHEKDSNIPLLPVYFNLRTRNNPKAGPLTQSIIDLSGRCMTRVAMDAHLTFDAAVGVPRAGTPFASALARLSGAENIELDKWEHEDKRCIGLLKSPVPASVKKVLLVDDVITGGDSKSEAVRNLRDEGMEVTDIIVLIDHELGGAWELRGIGCRLHSVFTTTELIGLYMNQSRMASRRA